MELVLIHVSQVSRGTPLDYAYGASEVVGDKSSAVYIGELLPAVFSFKEGNCVCLGRLLERN